MLLAEGLYPFHNLASFGRALFTVRKRNLLDTELTTRLRHPDQWAGAHFELALLAHLLTGEFTVEKHPNNARGRKADFRVAKGIEEIFLELNRREAEFPHGQARRNLELYEKLKLESVSQIFTCAEILESNQVAQKKETKRIFRLIKEKVKDQLPDEKPGIIIFQPTLP